MSRIIAALAAFAILAGVVDGWSQAPAPTPVPKQGNVLKYRPEEQKGLQLFPEEQQAIEELERTEGGTGAVAGGGGEQELWQLLRQRRYGTLRRRIVERQKADPKWQPPPRLVRLLREGVERALVQKAIREQRWQALAELAKNHPRQFTCRQLDQRWALAEAYHRTKDDERARAAYVTTFLECAKPSERQATLGKALGLLGVESARRVVDETTAKAKDAQARAILNSFAYDLGTRRIAEAFAAKRYSEASQMAVALAPQVRARKDEKTALLLAWNEFHQQRFAEAAAWFRTVLDWNPKERSAVEGLVLAETKLGKMDDARADAEKYLGQAAGRELPAIADALFAHALELYQAGRYREALAALDETERYRGKRRDSRLLHAWSRFHLGEVDEAGDEFEALYRDQHDRDAARGLAAVYLRRRDVTGLEKRAQSDGGALADAWRDYQARRYYDRKLFHLALPTAQGTFPELENVDSLALTLGAMVRDKSGREGLDQLRIDKLPYAKAEFFRHGHGFFLRADRVHLESGDLPANAPIGSFPQQPTPYSVRPTTRLEDAAEPTVGYVYEGDWVPYVELGTTPIEGEVSPLAVGRGGFTLYGDSFFWGLEGFARPVRESILSYTGIRDPYGSGKKFGRVVRVGGQLTLYRQIGEDWGASAQLTGAYLTGKEVAGNEQAAAGLSVSRSFKPPGFDYLAVGPQVSFEHYEKNLSQFTLGHGGYFSPDYLIQPVGSVNLLTHEGRPFIVKSDIGLGFQNHHQESSPFFPLEPDGRRYAATTESGFVFSGELLGVARLAEHWQAGFGGAARRTAHFHDESGLFFVRYLFEPRPAVFSSDFEYFHDIY